MATFIDMFAGAGGFSEGFLQAENGIKHFDFLLGSDINPTCEVTHHMRYNVQLGLNTQFLTKDITYPDFVEELLERVQENFGNTNIDVLTGGPPCQSFSLAGERRKNDKKDDLFSYYLKVIETLRPKYFIMENADLGYFTRRDTTYRAYVRLSSRYLEYKRIYPSISYTYTKRNSNAPIYEFDKHRIQIEINYRL